MKLPGLGSAENVDRVDSGEGYVHEHSFDIDNTVIVFRNIGSISIQEGHNSNWPIVTGFLLLAAGLLISQLSGALGVIFILLGIGLLVWGFMRSPELFLAIGTCDGRRTNLVSKDRAFLLQIRKFFQYKIDQNALDTATININARTITGGISFSDDSPNGQPK